MITQDQLKDVLDRADSLYRYLNIEQKQVEFEEEQLRTQAPDFWEDVKRAQEQMKKVKGIEKWIKGYKEVRQYADELQLAFAITCASQVIRYVAMIPVTGSQQTLKKSERPSSVR